MGMDTRYIRRRVDTMSSNLYRIVCLKRSNFVASNDHEYLSDWYNASSVVYWMPNRAGYTTRIEEAGLYTEECLKDCYGVHLDWFAMRVEREL